MRLREDHIAPKVAERPAPRFRNSSAGKPEPVRPKRDTTPHIGGLYGAPPVPQGQDTQTRRFMGEGAARHSIRTDYANHRPVFSSAGRPAPADSIRTTPDFMLMDVPRPFGPGLNDRGPMNADSSGRAAAAYLAYLKDLRDAAFQRDNEAFQYNPKRGTNPPHTAGNVARFDSSIDNNKLMQRILHDPTHGKDMLGVATSMGLPIPDTTIRYYAGQIIDGIKAGITKPEDIPNVVASNGSKFAIQNIQAKVKQLGYSQDEVLKMNFGQLLSAVAGRGKYRVGAEWTKNLPGHRAIPTAIHNLPGDAVSNLIGLVPAASELLAAGVRDFSEGIHQAQYAAGRGGGGPVDQTPFPNTRAYAREFAKQQIEFGKNLYNRPVGTWENMPLTVSLLGWSALHGGAGAAGRLPMFARAERFRPVNLGNYYNEGEAGVLTRSPMPGQRGLPGLNPDDFIDPRFPRGAIGGPGEGPTAGAPTVHERQAKLPGFSGATHEAGRAEFDPQVAMKEYSARTGKKMTFEQLQQAKHEFDQAYNTTDHVARHQQQINNVEAARAKEAAQSANVDPKVRTAERIKEINSLYQHRNDLVTKLARYETDANAAGPHLQYNARTLRNDIQFHQDQIKELTDKLNAGDSPTLDHARQGLIDAHQHAINFLTDVNSRAGTHVSEFDIRSQLHDIHSTVADATDYIVHDHLDVTNAHHRVIAMPDHPDQPIPGKPTSMNKHIDIVDDAVNAGVSNSSPAEALAKYSDKELQDSLDNIHQTVAALKDTRPIDSAAYTDAHFIIDEELRRRHTAGESPQHTSVRLTPKARNELDFYVIGSDVHAPELRKAWEASNQGKRPLQLNPQAVDEMRREVENARQIAQDNLDHGNPTGRERQLYHARIRAANHTLEQLPKSRPERRSVSRETSIEGARQELARQKARMETLHSQRQQSARGRPDMQSYIDNLNEHIDRLQKEVGHFPERPTGENLAIAWDTLQALKQELDLANRSHGLYRERQKYFSTEIDKAQQRVSSLEAEIASYEATPVNPTAGTEVVPYQSKTPTRVPDRAPTFGEAPKHDSLLNLDTFNKNAREHAAAKAIHGEQPPPAIAPANGALEPSRAITGSTIKKMEDPLTVYRLPYSKNLIDRAVEWIDDRMLESTNPNLKWYQDRFLRNRYAVEQGHVRRAFYMWREDLGPLLEAAKKVTTEEGLAVVGAYSQGVSVDHMVRFYEKLLKMDYEKLRRAHWPQELKDDILKRIPDDKTLQKFQDHLTKNGLPEQAKIIQDFRNHIKNEDYIDDGLFGAFVSSFWDASIDLKKQHELWTNIRDKLGNGTHMNDAMRNLLEEMRKASNGVDNMIAEAGVLPRAIMDNRRYQRQNIVSSVLGEEIPLDTQAVYVPDRATAVMSGEYLFRRSRRYDPEGIFGGRLKKHKGKLLLEGKINPSFGSYYTNLTSAKSKLAAVHLQRHILDTYAKKVGVDQISFDRNRFTLYNGQTGMKYRDIQTRAILDELNKIMAGEEAQYGLANLGNRQEIVNRSLSMPFHKSAHADIRNLTADEIAQAKRGDLYLVPNPIMESIVGQVTHRQPNKLWLRGVQRATNAWRTLVLKLRPAYLPVNIAESAGRAGLYGGVGPFDYTRALKLNKRMQHKIDPRTGKTYAESGIDPLSTLVPDWLYRTTFTGDITSKLHIPDKPMAEKIQAAKDMMVKGSRNIRELPGGPLVLDTGRFVLGGYGEYVFRATAEGENLMRVAHVTQELLSHVNAQKYKWWQPGRYFGRLNENAFEMMQKVARGEDISQGAKMEEILRDTSRLLGDFSKAHKAGWGIAVPFYRWVAFITKFTLMEAMYRRPGRAALYGAISRMTWSQLQQLGLMPPNIAGAIPMGQLEQGEKVDPGTHQRDKLMTVLYSQAWNGPMTLVNSVGLDPGTNKFHFFEGGMKQMNPLAQLLVAASALRDPSTLREFKGPNGESLDRTDIFGTFGRVAVAQLARQLWPVMLNQDYSKMADTSIPYINEQEKSKNNPLGQPQSSTGEKLFALITGFRRRKIDLTKLQMTNLKAAKAELTAIDTALHGNYPDHVLSPAQKKFRAQAQKDFQDMAAAAQVWWDKHHTNPFDEGQIYSGLPTAPILPSSSADEDAFNQQQLGTGGTGSYTGPNAEDAFNQANQ